MQKKRAFWPRIVSGSGFFQLAPRSPPLSRLRPVWPFFLKKRREAVGVDASFSRRSARVICAACLLFPLILFGVELSGRTFLSIPLLNLFANANTRPSVVRPGESVQVRIEYSPGVSSIQQRHSFESVTVSNLSYRPASGQPGIVELSDPPRARVGPLLRGLVSVVPCLRYG